MAEIYRNVTIKPALMKADGIVIKGHRGGEMIFSLSKHTLDRAVQHRNKKRPLIVNCYRTKKLEYVDVSEYNGNKGETIKVILNNKKRFVGTVPMLYLFDPDNRIIEYGRLKRMNGRRVYEILYYETRISHEFNEVKIVCFEDFCQQ